MAGCSEEAYYIMLKLCIISNLYISIIIKHVLEWAYALFLSIPSDPRHICGGTAWLPSAAAACWTPASERDGTGCNKTARKTTSWKNWN
uniref:Uncharacterized protein n=1 Tax=Arundo donax TaxID=35708 RepID=A0A0A9FP02_ARUDO